MAAGNPDGKRKTEDGNRPRVNRIPRQLTLWDGPAAIVDSGWGRVDNATWCRLEADRQAELGVMAYVRRNCGTNIAVFVGPPAGAGVKCLYIGGAS